MLLETGFLRQYPHVTQALHEIMKQCVLLAKAGCHDPECEEITPESTVDDRTKANIPECPDPDIGRTATYPSIPPLTNEYSDQSSFTAFTAPNQKSSAPPTSLHIDQAVLPFGVINPISSPESTSSWSLTLAYSPALLFTYMSHEPYLTFPQRLVRACFQAGYRLLTNPSANLHKIKQVFGFQVTSADRDRLASLLLNILQNEGGDAIDYRARVLTDLRYDSIDSLYSKRRQDISFSSRKPAIDAEPSGEWLDAYNVQSFLQEKGIAVEGNVSTVRVQSTPDTRLNSAFPGPVVFDVMSLIAGMFFNLFSGYSVQNDASYATVLSTVCICVGQGPAFLRHHVEMALRFAILKSDEST